MVFTKKCTPVGLAAAMVIGGLAAVPTVASAEVSASLNIANMYLWRGQNLTPDGSVVSGSLDYSHESGAYAGIWTSSETGGSETDLYAGFGGEAADISYDISYWYYMYPENTDTSGFVDLSDNALAEILLGLGYADFGATFYISSETQGGPDYIYYTLDYTIGDFNILYGAWDIDEPGTANEYDHVTFKYMATENLTFGVSVASSSEGEVVEEDPLFLVSYNIPIDMGKM